MIERTLEPELMDFDMEAEAYARADFAAVNGAFVERLIELAGDTEHVRALDLGTGPADIPYRLTCARPQWSVTAVDAAFAMLRFAPRCNHLLLIQADAKALPFPEESFDIVFSNSILHHLPDPGPFWAQVKSVARPGALIFLRDLTRPASDAQAQAIVERYAGDESDLLKEEFYRSLLAAFTLEEVKGQLSEAGLEVLQCDPVADRHLDVFGRLGE